ncbi:MAG: hypothetical protein H6598_06470 [Flavobacteriales bacterium]|nr:hypothetical protein [Flavobacteriales bacterium]
MKSKHLLIGLGLLCLLPSVNAQIGGKIGSVKDKAKEKVSNTTTNATGNVAVSAYDKHMNAGREAEEKGDFILAYKEYKLALAEKSGDYMATSAKSNVESKAEEQFVAKYKESLAKGNCSDVKTVLNDHMETIDMTPTSKEKLAAKINSCEKDVANMKQAGDNAAKQPKQDALLEEAVPLIEAGKIAEAKVKLQQAYDACPTCDQAEEIKGTITALDQMGAMEDMKYKCETIPTDNGMSGSFHEANVGKIVFSKAEIIKGQENPSAMTSSFTTADNIYSRVYMAHSIGYECANMGICFGDPYHQTIYRYTVDGGKYSFSKSYYDDGTMTFNGVSEDQMNKWTTWQPAISPSSKEGYGTHELQFFYSMIEFLPAGSHTIKLEIVIDIPEDQQPAGSRTEENCRKYTSKFGEEKVLAVGEFTLEIKEADKAKIKAKTGALSKAELDKKNQDTFNSTMENSGVWVINKCSSAVKITAGGNSVTVNGNSSARLNLKAGDSITNSSGSVIRYFSSDPPAGKRTDVIICN